LPKVVCNIKENISILDSIKSFGKFTILVSSFIVEEENEKCTPFTLSNFPPLEKI